MKIRAFIIAWAVSIVGGFSISFATIAPNVVSTPSSPPPSTLQSPNTQAQSPNQPNDPNKPPSYTAPQKLDNQKATLTDAEKQELLAKQSPEVQKNVLKYGWPKDNDFYGYESEMRAEYRNRAVVSGNGMRAMDTAVTDIRKSETGYQDFAATHGIVCGDMAAEIFPLLQTGIDSALYKSGNYPTDWRASDALTGMGYQYMPPGTEIRIGDVVVGGGHSFTYWQTANDALGQTSYPNGAGVAQWADSSYATNLNYAAGGNEGLFRPMQTPYIENMTNPNNNLGPVNQINLPDSELGRWWINWKQTNFPEPEVYNQMRYKKNRG